MFRMRLCHIVRNYEVCWQKYSYIFQLVASIVFSSIIIFFTEMYDAKDIDWWGNNVVYKGMDYMMNGWLNATIDAPDWLF